MSEPLRGHADAVQSLAFSPDGNTLASGGYDNIIRFWDVASQQVLGEPLMGHSDVVHSVVFSPDGKTLASAGWNGGIRLWDVANQHSAGKPLRGHSDTVHNMVFDASGKTLISSGWDNTIRLWDIDPASWVNKAWAIVNRNFTQQEWRQYMGALPYEETCPGFPNATLIAIQFDKALREQLEQDKADDIEAKLVTRLTSSENRTSANSFDTNAMPSENVVKHESEAVSNTQKAQSNALDSGENKPSPSPLSSKVLSPEEVAKRRELYKNFKRRVICDEDVPPDMRVVRTPFGDRLVPYRNKSRYIEEYEQRPQPAECVKDKENNRQAEKAASTNTQAIQRKELDSNMVKSPPHPFYPRGLPPEEIAKRRELSKDFKKRDIRDEDVPLGMHVVRTQFGDQLVPDNSKLKSTLSPQEESSTPNTVIERVIKLKSD